MNGYVYILDAGNAVKIGKSINPKTRIASIENEIGKKMLRYFASPDCSNYSDIEKAMHEIFADQCIEGEWFNIEFDEAVNILQSQQFDNTKDISPDEAGKKIKGKMAIMTLRADGDTLSIANAIAALKRETTSDVLRRALDDYIEKNKGLLGETFDQLDKTDIEAK